MAARALCGRSMLAWRRRQAARLVSLGAAELASGQRQVNILALDLGVRTGWALANGSRRLESGVQTFDLKRGESPGMRYVRFNRWLREVLPAPTIRTVADAQADDWLVVYELAHHRGGAATEIHSGLATRVQEFCAERGYEHAAVHSATLKKFATGKGNADKDMMVATVLLKWPPAGRSLISDDEADAIALAQYALATLL